MDLEIKDRLFVVTGATSGLGRGVALALLAEGAKIIAVGRDENKLTDLAGHFADQTETVRGDVTHKETIKLILDKIGHRQLSGILINAGGPPARAFLETTLDDWDSAYQNLLRWKVEITQSVLRLFRLQKYGRMLFIESSSVKQPVTNLVLSNSMRLSVVGFVKTLSQEIAKEGITCNILAPGFHDTPAARRLYIKRSQVENITVEEAELKYKSEIPVGVMGNPADFGTLAAWLLSPLSQYVTGQTISIDGGSVKFIMG